MNEILAPGDDKHLDPKWFNYRAGSCFWLILAVLLGLGLAALTVWATPFVVHLPELPSEPDGFVRAYINEAIGLFALVGITIGAIAAILRALAHKRSEALDHTGKLLAVTAFAFAFWVAGFRIPETAGNLSPWVLGAAILIVAIATIVVSVRAARRRQVKPTAIPAGGNSRA